MELQENFYSVLIVSSSEKFNNTIERLLPDNRYYPIRIVLDGGTAARTLLELSFDFILINTPLTDEFGTHLASYLSRKTDSGILLFVRSEHFADISARLTPMGILTLSKPADAQLILETMSILCGSRSRQKRLGEKTVSFEKKMAEIRLINRAKLLLCSREGYSEAQAHRYIEKTAMDGCISKKTVAEEIINRYSEMDEAK